jgi:hypothetical protein
MENVFKSDDYHSSETQEVAEDVELAHNRIRIYLRVRPVQDPTDSLELSTEEGRATFIISKTSG